MAERTEVSIHICGRRPASAECSELGCRNPATSACTVALKGRKEGQTCGRQLCAKCGGQQMICPPHQRQQSVRRAA